MVSGSHGVPEGLLFSEFARHGQTVTSRIPTLQGLSDVRSNRLNTPHELTYRHKARRQAAGGRRHQGNARDTMAPVGHLMRTETSEGELQRLMSAGLNGNADAHRALLTLISGRLRAFFKGRLVRIGHGAVEAEDLVQEVLLAVHTRRHTYDVSQPFTPWLYGIARYKFLDYLRRTRASMHNVTIDDAADMIARDDFQGVESSYDVEKMMAGLAPKMREAIRQVKLEGLSVSEAAARSGMSPSAVKVSVHRGMKALARLIAKENER